MAHYGFMPDSEVPSGRINPYLGVGPAIVWTGVSLRPALLVELIPVESLPLTVATIP